MNNDVENLINTLAKDHSLSFEQWVHIIKNYSDSDREYAAVKARSAAEKYRGNKIYFRGIVEFTNICKNNCLYCGIRRDNIGIERYRLSKEQILDCCKSAYSLGFRTFVLQGGEDSYFTDKVLGDIVYNIKSLFPDCAVTLSVGERSYDSYKALYDAGADRYLLRHETITPEHYAKLHPPFMSLENRIKCLYNLREIGYAVGCGMMIGSPFQTAEDLARDMLFISDFKPDMIGTGPFIPHSATPFRDFEQGSATLTLFILSLCRLAMPSVLLPATTALGTAKSDGRRLGILAGANVIMPNISPLAVRKDYMLYDNKAGTENTPLSELELIAAQLENTGYFLSSERGDKSND